MVTDALKESACTRRNLGIIIRLMAKQPELHIEGKGAAAVHIPEIDAAADAYFKERDKRCRITPREVAAKQKLMDTMHKHEAKLGRNGAGVLTYRFDDQILTLEPGKEKLKVRSEAEDEE